MTKFFVEDNETFKACFLIEKTSGKPLIFPSVEGYLDYFRIADASLAELHWYEFRNWTWGIENWVRERSTEIDPMTGLRRFNGAAWKENKFKYLLVGWSITDPTGAGITLNRTTIEGRPQLDEPSLRRVFSVSHSINTVALALADKVLVEGESPDALLDAEDFKALQKGEIPERIKVHEATLRAPPKN